MAIALAFLVAPARGQSATEPQNAAQPSASENRQPAADNAITPTVSVPAKQEQVRSDIYNPECGKPKDHDEADLCVQRETAKAANDAVTWAERQTYIGCAGLAFVVLTLWFTYKAAAAGQRSAEIAEYALTRLEYPFLTIGNFTAEFWAGGTVLIKYGFKNRGRTPAFITGLSIAVVPGDTLPTKPEYSEKRQPIGALVIGQGEESPTFDSWYQAETGADVKLISSNGGGTVIFYGLVRYLDIFGGEHVNGFCIRCWHKDGNNRWSAAETDGYSYHCTPNRSSPRRTL